MSNETMVRIAPIQMPRSLKDQIDGFARDHGQMSFAAAVRYLITRGLEAEDDTQRGNYDLHPQSA